MECYASAARMENARACQYLGLLYERGVPDIEKDFNKAKFYFEKAASLGFSVAQCTLGDKYDVGNSILPHDREKAIKFWKLAAKGGHATSQYLLAVLFFSFFFFF